MQKKAFHFFLRQKKGRGIFAHKSVGSLSRVCVVSLDREKLEFYYSELSRGVLIEILEFP